MNKLKHIIIFCLIFFCSYGISMAQDNSQIEKDNIKAITAEINNKIPSGTVITSHTINLKADLIKYIIERHGYTFSKDYRNGGYTMKIFICNNGHVHYDIYIALKKGEGVWVITAYYPFKKLNEI